MLRLSRDSCTVPPKSGSRERALQTFWGQQSPGRSRQWLLYLCVDDVGDVARGEQRHPHVLQQLRQRRLALLLRVLHPVDHRLEHRLLRVHLQTGAQPDQVAAQRWSYCQGAYNVQLLHSFTASKGARDFSYKSLREIPISIVNSLIFFSLNLHLLFLLLLR